MKVQFDFTAADLAELAERSSNRSKVIRRLRRQGYAVAAGLVALVVYAIVSGPPLARLAFAAFVGIAFYLALPGLTGFGAHRRRLERVLRERLGGDGPFTCEVELAPEALITRQLGTESKHAWSQVSSVADIPQGIEFVYRPIGSLLVRNRAFASNEARAEFLSLARQLAGGNVKRGGR